MFVPGKGSQKRKTKARTFSPKSKRPRLQRQPSRQGKESPGKWKQERRGSRGSGEQTKSASLIKFVSRRSRQQGSGGDRVAQGSGKGVSSRRSGGIRPRKGGGVPPRRKVAGGKVFRKKAKTT